MHNIFNCDCNSEDMKLKIDKKFWKEMKEEKNWFQNCDKQKKTSRRFD